MRREQTLRSIQEAQHRESSSSKMTGASETMLRRLKARRFRAIFDYLDTAGVGVVDLPLIIRQQSVMDSLEKAVREDVERAAALVMTRAARGGEGAPVLLDVSGFSSVMEEVLGKYRGPRGYLVPTPTPKQVDDACTFRPAVLRASAVSVGCAKQSVGVLKGWKSVYGSAHACMHHCGFCIALLLFP